MKIALVHELLTMRGGAERVLRILADMFPDAPIYTLLYDQEKLSDWFPHTRVKTSEVRPIFGYNHHLYLKKFPKAVEAWDFSEYDLVISTSSAFVHGIITNGTPKHLCYVHSPARYLWDRTHDVIAQASHGPFGTLKKAYLTQRFHKLRIWDAEAADRPDRLLAASKAVKRRIELYWRRPSDVVYPPIDDRWFVPTTKTEKTDDYLVASSLVRYKRIDLAILACNALKRNLVIAGEGPDAKRLRALAGPTVRFVGYASQEDMQKHLTASRALLFPGDEDFGLVPLESMACGTPVISYRSGGALETMIEGETGEFFDEATPDSLQQAILKFEQKKYSKDVLFTQAKKFSRKEFERNIRAEIEKIMH